ncbi:hypothetical protein DYBT9275_00903 [Dyadobacter sp. CECT 9275]|uniref:Uncharacterized protein n=1 Tax=Dyadobacter helix TaxID=2822344 RepID=A0A916J9H7_9BACT|nr:hypothetical protein [Dyadobacter sp. CECT 9275]CAG4992148.1 hypothetical protein DYBT9275_00903 [Dyadobacter sp. CECT 9275]
MSKPNALTAIIGSLFSRSEKPISEKLSTEEFNAFMQDAGELDARLSAQGQGNEKVTADLAAANAQIIELTASLATSAAKVKELTATLAAVSAERDTYKGHYDKAAAAGQGKANEDENSRGSSEATSYNAHALEVFHKTHGKA